VILGEGFIESGEAQDALDRPRAALDSERAVAVRATLFQLDQGTNAAHVHERDTVEIEQKWSVYGSELLESWHGCQVDLAHDGESTLGTFDDRDRFERRFHPQCLR
jgi:hypothetical protein